MRLTCATSENSRALWRATTAAERIPFDALCNMMESVRRRPGTHSSDGNVTVTL